MAQKGRYAARVQKVQRVQRVQKVQRVVVSPLRGDKYKDSVTGFPIASPVLHDEVPEPPSLGRGGVAP